MEKLLLIGGIFFLALGAITIVAEGDPVAVVFLGGASTMLLMSAKIRKDRIAKSEQGDD